MRLLRWFTQNVADTGVPTHADLAPLSLPGGADQAAEAIRRVVAGAKNWQLAPNSADGVLHLTRRTGLLGYTDDVRLTLSESGGSTQVNARSHSRVGSGDLGQNRRNILELWALVRAARGES